jgi:hypothetical protein
MIKEKNTINIKKKNGETVSILRSGNKPTIVVDKNHGKFAKISDYNPSDFEAPNFKGGVRDEIQIIKTGKNRPSMSRAINKVIRNKLAKKAFTRQIGPTNSYLNNLKFPEFAMGAQVPQQSGTSTAPVHRHLTYSISTNATGYAAIFFQPFYLADATFARSTFGLQNNVAYDGATTFTGGLIAQPYKYAIPAGNVASFRLVSASLQIQPQIPLLNITGKIGGAVISYVAVQGQTSGTNLVNDPLIQTIADIEQFDYYAEADLCAQESLRLLWLPHDVHDFELYALDTDGGVVAQSMETTMVAYIQGAPASSNFNVEIYLNFELTPLSGSILQGMTQMNFDTTNPWPISITLRSQPQLVASAFLTQGHLEDIGMSQVKSSVGIGKTLRRYGTNNISTASRNVRSKPRGYR